MLGSDREIRLLDLDLRRSGASTVLVDGSLSLLGSLLSVALCGLESLSSMLVSKLLDLLSLLVGDVVTLLDLSVNDLLVLDVDERTEEGDHGGDQGQTPERNELDQEVREEGSEESLY